MSFKVDFWNGDEKVLVPISSELLKIFYFMNTVRSQKGLGNKMSSFLFFKLFDVADNIFTQLILRPTKTVITWSVV